MEPGAHDAAHGWQAGSRERRRRDTVQLVARRVGDDGLGGTRAERHHLIAKPEVADRAHPDRADRQARTFQASLWRNLVDRCCDSDTRERDARRQSTDTSTSNDGFLDRGHGVTSLCQTVQWLAAVVGDHVAQRGCRIDRRAKFSAVELGVGAVEVADDPLRVTEPAESTEIGLLCHLQRRETRHLAAPCSVLYEAEVGFHLIDGTGVAHWAVARHERPGLERAEPVQGAERAAYGA